MLVGVDPPDDVSVEVRGERVGGVRARTRITLQRRPRRTSLRVVGEGAEHFLVAADRDPLGTVHRGGAHDVGGPTGVDEDLLGTPPGERRIGRTELEPLAGAVLVEPGHVEGAVVEGMSAAGAHRLPVAS